MKHTYSIITILSLASCIFLSCKDDISDVGASVQPEGDKITMKSGVFETASLQTQIVDSVFVKSDSLLLGLFADKTFGTANADILTQLMPPLDFVFPRDAAGNIKSEIDSACIEITYTSWVGDGNAIMRLHAYELNRAIFDYNEQYPSNIKVSDYCDLSQPLAATVITPNKGNFGAERYISMKLPDEFAQRFFPANDREAYSSKEKFLEFFKGIYLTADFGNTAMLNVSSITLNYYYHYIGNDGELVPLTLPFVANREVVRVNRIEHPNRNEIVIPDTLTYVSSPANFYTKISVPIKEIYEELNRNIGNRELTVSTALLEIDAKNVSNTNYLKMPTTLLAVKESAYNRFFTNREIPSANDTCASYGRYVLSTLTDTDTTYTYTFELSKLLAIEFQNAKEQGILPADTLQLMLLPITLNTSSSYITGATHYLPLSGVALKKKTRLKVLYNGF